MGIADWFAVAILVVLGGWAAFMFVRRKRDSA